MQGLIAIANVQLVEPPCLPGADRWSARVHLQQDISEALPYLNAELPNADYDHGTKTLIWKDKGRKHAFRPYEIAIAPVESKEEARALVTELAQAVDDIWERRDEIEPSLELRELPTALAVYRLLPRTNCGECGYPTCLAYAAALREGSANLSQCPCLSRPEHAANSNDLRRLLKGA